MAIYGYHRVSTTDQHLDKGIKEINDYCTQNNLDIIDVYTDKQTGKNFKRPEYDFIRKRIVKGDVLIISELDRLGRNKQDTLKELQYFKDKDVRVMILEIPTTLQDFSKLDNKMASMIMETINSMLVEMYATFAQFEIEKKEKRQREGIEAKKQRDEWGDYGRPHIIDFKVFSQEYKKVIDGTMKPFECMRQLGMKKATFYKYAGTYKKSL